MIITMLIDDVSYYHHAFKTKSNNISLK